MEEETYSEFEVEAAMCLWEAFMSYTLWDKDGIPATPIGEKLQTYLEGVGYAQTRLDVMAKAKLCCIEFEKFGDSFNGCFDWDYCPAFIHRLVEEGYFD